jgi:hypothetical protein
MTIVHHLSHHRLHKRSPCLSRHFGAEAVHYGDGYGHILQISENSILKIYIFVVY